MSIPLKLDEAVSLIIAQHLDNDHAIRSEKRPAPMRRPCAGRAQARITVSDINSELNQIYPSVGEYGPDVPVHPADAVVKNIV